MNGFLDTLVQHIAQKDCHEQQANPPPSGGGQPNQGGIMQLTTTSAAQAPSFRAGIAV
jgi:hypothetical protein